MHTSIILICLSMRLPRSSIGPYLVQVETRSQDNDTVCTLGVAQLGLHYVHRLGRAHRVKQETAWYALLVAAIPFDPAHDPTYIRTGNHQGIFVESANACGTLRPVLGDVGEALSAVDPITAYPPM